MDAILYLKQEHNKIRHTLKQIAKISNIDQKKAKFREFCQDILSHETMEQQIWYPTLRRIPDLRDRISHLISEEKTAAKAIQKFKGVKFDFMWNLRFYKLSHDIEHHAEEEEQKLFPLVRAYLGKGELNQLGIAMRKYKLELKAEIAELV